MTRFVLSPSAVRDLQDIRDYIAKDSTSSARRVMQVMRDKMRMLAETPGIGHYRDDLPDSTLRVWNVYSYVIVYRPNTTPLEVVRVVGGAQDFARHHFG